MALCAVAAVLVAPRVAGAATCSINGVNGVAFGSYDTAQIAALDSTGSISITCSSVGVLDLLRIDLDKGGGTGFFSRRMLNGAHRLDYNLYLDPTRLLVWGDGTGGTVHYGPITPPSGSLTLSVYGRIPPLQSVAAGSYADSVVVNVVF